MTRTERKIAAYAAKRANKDGDPLLVVSALLRVGMAMFRDSNGMPHREAVIRLNENGGVSIETPNKGAVIVANDDRETLVSAVEACLTQFSLYADLHDAKGTPESAAKADTNREFVDICAHALGKRAARPARKPQEHEFVPTVQDSPVTGAPVPLAAAGADAVLAMRARLTESAEWMAIPDDRTGFFFEGLDQHLTVLERAYAAGGKTDLALWITRKANQAKSLGHSDISNALTALVAEMGHGLEEQPIDIEKALREFFVDVHDRNVKAGWWSDLSNGSPKKRSVGELFVLMVTELAEAYKAYCAEDMDDKLPEYPGLGVEMGDVLIRVADFCGALIAGRVVSYEGIPNPGDQM